MPVPSFPFFLSLFPFFDIAYNASSGNWDAVAFDVGSFVGGGLVGTNGGGWYVAETMMGKPSNSPNTWNPITIFRYEAANRYKPSMGPPNLTYMATSPTPASGGTFATFIGSVVGVLFNETCSDDTDDDTVGFYY